MHSEHLQAKIVEAAEKLSKLGEKLLITIVVQDLNESNPGKGVQVCSNLSPDTTVQAEYLKRIAQAMK